ncbi:MAG: HD domain-containing protein [Methylococcaceae bacterium]
MNYPKEIVFLLGGTGREGMKGLFEYLAREGFFTSPASTKFHGCYEGGLAEHSYKVYSYLREYVSKRKMKLDAVTSVGQKPLPIKPENLIIAGLLHDVCKIGAYLGSEKPYSWNKKTPKGHALLSIERIEKFIKLEDIEKLMIKFHMGIYGAYDFYEKGSWDYKKNAEYPLRGDHTNDKKMSREESKKIRYGKSLANAWYHNPICKIFSMCDEIETLEAKAAMLEE